MFNVPNAITIARACATPWLAWLLLSHAYGAALALFVACAFADLADGMIARRFNLRTRFGSIADPLADKLTMLTVVWLLALQDWAPVWFAVLSVARDAVIVTGATAFHFMVGRFDMAPSWLSKFNTALEFTLLAALLALAAGLFGEGAWLRVLLYVTTATVLASGVQYVWVWGRKAAVERKGKRTLA